MVQKTFEKQPHLVHLDSGSGEAQGLTITALAKLPPGTMLDEKALAIALEVSTRTIRRMVDRREIPTGVKLGSRKVWFSDMVLAFLLDRAQRETAKSKRLEKTFCNFGRILL